MPIDRRTFLSASAASAAWLGLPAPDPMAGAMAGAPAAARSQGTERKPLRILILGGTNLTGPHNVRYALERGHSVSIFTRGKTQPGLFQDAFQEVEHLIGDREDNLEALKGREWDAVIDASGRKESWTRATAELLKDAAKTYLYISSTGVYYPYLKAGLDESDPPALEDPSKGKNGSYAYGVMKARSENVAREAFGEDRAIVVRPGYIVGPLDRTHRGTYWPTRIRRGGDVVVPGAKADLVQQIDVRDLTEFMIRLLERGGGGTYNATGPGTPTSMAEFVYGVKGAFSSDVTWHWIDDQEFLSEHRLTFAIPWIMPEGDHLGSQRISVQKAREASLTFRPIAKTALDTLEWYDTLPMEKQNSPPMALSPDRETKILTAWKAR